MSCCHCHWARCGSVCSFTSCADGRCCRCTVPNSTRLWAMSEPRNNREVVHEESDVNVRAIFGFGAGLFAVAVVVHLLLWLMMNQYNRKAADLPRNFPLSAAYQQQAPPEPRLQTHPQEDLRQLREREQQILEGYG